MNIPEKMQLRYIWITNSENPEILEDGRIVTRYLGRSCWFSNAILGPAFGDPKLTEGCVGIYGLQGSGEPIRRDHRGRFAKRGVTLSPDRFA
jgi:hypothetical protein